MSEATTTIPDQFLSKTDREYISEIALDYLNEKDIQVQAFEFQITITYRPYEFKD